MYMEQSYNVLCTESLGYSRFKFFLLVIKYLSIIPAFLAAIKSLSLSPNAIEFSGEILLISIAFSNRPGIGFLQLQLSNGGSENDG